MADESIGTARIDVVVDTSSFDAAITSAKRSVSSMSQAAQQAYTQLNAVEKRRVDSLIKQADTLGFTREQQILYNAALKGTPTAILDELKSKLVGVSGAQQAMNAAQSGSTKSVKELQFALRGVPAQFTDIATSLASGQRPLQVLLQQGGQLKDMFGGIGPAAKALGGYILGLVNPITLAVAAIAAVGYAAYQGQEDIDALNEAVIKGGGYAGVSGRALNDMANQIGAATGKFGPARDAINALAGSGSFTGAGLGGLAKQAVDTAKVTGESMDKVVESITKLNAKPSETIAALNEQYHFLTAAQYTQIAALEEQGRTQEAARLANKLDAEAMADRARDVESNANWMVKSAHFVATEWGKAWAAVKGLVTPAGLAEQAAGYQAQIDALQRPRIDRQGNLVGANNSDEIKRLQGLLADVRRQQAQQGLSATNQALTDGLNQDAIAAQQRLSQFASPSDTRDNALAKANRDHLAALYGVVDPSQRAKIDAEYQAQVKAAKDAYANATKDKSADFWGTPIGNDPRAGLTASIGKEVDAYKKEADQWARSTSAAVAYRATLQDMLDTRQRAIDLQVASIGMGQREVQQQSDLIAIDEDYNRKKAELQKRQQDATSALDKDGYQSQLDDLAKYHDQRVQMEKDGFAREAAARSDASLGAKAALADFTDSAGDVAGQTHDLFTNAFDGMADALANFATTGKLNFKDLATSIISDMAKIEARILVSQALQSMFGGYGGTNGQGSLESDSNGFVTHVNAKGGVYDSPSLSAYSGQIVSKPTMFAFAKGAGLMGEAGPEAIMPLRRGPDGRLGVASSGSSAADVQVEVNVTNNGQPVQARQTGVRQDGQKVIVDMVLDAVASDMAIGGRTAKAAQQRFGLQRRGVPVSGG